MTIKQNGGVFGRNPTFNDVTIEGTLTFDGDIDINSDLKVDGDIETTGNVIIGTAGKGIDFSATTGTGTSELFSDYEEGVFSPEASFGGGSGTITYGSQAGSYTKIGNVVTIRISLATTSIALRTGNMTITGLPFASGAGTYAAASCGYGAGLALTAGHTMAGYISQNSSLIQMTRFSIAGGTVLVTSSQWTDDGSTMISAQYNT